MKSLQQIKAQDILTTNFIIKFFDKEKFADSLFNTGEMLFRPIKSFKESEQQGRGDINEGKVNCHFSLYGKKVEYALYKKLGDITEVHLDINRPIYCYSRLSGLNFHPDGTIYLNPQMLKDFGSREQTYCAIVDRVPFENKIFNYLKTQGLGVTIANVKYSDNDVDYKIIVQVQTGKSDIAYFQKSMAYSAQQERRIVLSENIDYLVKHGIGKRFNDGIKIKIVNLMEMGYIAKTVNFY